MLKGTSSRINAICDLLRSHVAKTEIFKPRHALLHCTNGMLEITEVQAILHPFSPNYYSRNPISVAWNPQALCPSLSTSLLRPALDDDDVDLLIRWGGSVRCAGLFQNPTAPRIVSFA